MIIAQEFVGRCDLCRDVVFTSSNESHCKREFASRTMSVTIGETGYASTIRVCKPCIETGRIYDSEFRRPKVWKENV